MEVQNVLFVMYYIIFQSIIFLNHAMWNNKPFSENEDFRRQHMTSTDIRFWRGDPRTEIVQYF